MTSEAYLRRAKTAQTHSECVRFMNLSMRQRQIELRECRK